MRNILLSYFEFGPVVQEEKSFKDILSIALASFLLSASKLFVQL